MKLPFVIVSRGTWDELIHHRGVRDRIGQSHRWLAEFDWFLIPLWAFLLDPNQSLFNEVEGVRRTMREQLVAHEARKDNP